MTWHPDMPMEYRNQIVTGDARVLAERIPDESVDIVFTSPPYNVGMEYENWNDKLSDPEFWELQRDWIASAFRIATEGARMYAIVGDKLLWQFRALASLMGWRFHQLLVWCKPNIVTSSKITKDWNCMTEWGLLFHKGKRTPMRGDVQGVNTFNWIVATATQSNFTNDARKVHPAQMPLVLAYTWLARTPGEIVYDPFIGSGTTAQAAKKLGKHWIGFEIGPATAYMARQRVAETQPPLPRINEMLQVEMEMT